MYDDAMSVAKANKEKEELDGYWKRRLAYERTSGDMTMDYVDRAEMSYLISMVEIDAEVLAGESGDRYIVKSLVENVERLRKAWNEAEKQHLEYLAKGYEQM
jgi:hypothetical protein